MNAHHPAALPEDIRSRLDRLALAMNLEPSSLRVVISDHLADHCLSTSGSFGSRPWVAVVSSHLGHNSVLHRDVCRNLAQSMIQCRRRNAVLLVAKDSAIDSWAMRAAELFGVPAVQIVLGTDDAKTDAFALRLNTTDSAPLSRDAVVVFMADRVDAVYVRRKGKIAKAMLKRLEIRQDATTRVATTSLPKCAAKELIQAGAIGWINVQQLDRQTDVAKKQPLDHEPTFADEWMHQYGQWFVHCTRACDGAWPGQTDSQYRDQLLLSVDASARTPVQTLERIIRPRRLIASAIASAKAFPVVCFSAVALADLLIARSYRPHLKRWDYEPWGIAIRKSAAVSAGVQEVIYGIAKDRQQIPAADQFRFQAAGKTYDWTVEREWRAAGDLRLDEFDPNDIRVFVANAADKQQVEKYCPWKISVL